MKNKLLSILIIGISFLSCMQVDKNKSLKIKPSLKSLDSNPVRVISSNRCMYDQFLEQIEKVIGEDVIKELSLDSVMSIDAGLDKIVSFILSNRGYLNRFQTNCDYTLRITDVCYERLIEQLLEKTFLTTQTEDRLHTLMNTRDSLSEDEKLTLIMSNVLKEISCSEY